MGLLKQDHAHVKALLARFDRARGAQKQSLASTICAELKVHTTLEEEIFYPAARRALADQSLLDEAQVEHESAKQLIAQIENSTPEDELFDAKVKVLGEYVLHHVKEEEGELFPELRETDLDLGALGERMQRRKEQLQARGKSDTARRTGGDEAGTAAWR